MDPKLASKHKEIALRPNIKLMMKVALDHQALKSDKIKMRHKIRTDYHSSKLSERSTKNHSETNRIAEVKGPAAKPPPSQQKSFSSEKNGDLRESSTYFSARTPGVHKRTKTFGDRHEFLASKPKATVELNGSKLMQKLSEKLQIDIGKFVRNNPVKSIDAIAKKPRDEGRLGPLPNEPSSLARKIAEIKASKPLTDRANLNHIIKSPPIETAKSTGMAGLIKQNHFVISDKIRRNHKTDSFSSPNVHAEAKEESGQPGPKDTPSILKHLAKAPFSAKPDRPAQKPPTREQVRTPSQVKESRHGVTYMVSSENIGSAKKRPAGHKPTKSAVPAFQEYSKFELSNPDKVSIPSFDKTRTILRPLGPLAGFCVNTNKGNTRNYNEDRVSVLLNAQQKYALVTRFEKGHFLHEVEINLFGVFDGHGGNRCSNYLKDNLFNELLNNRDFPRSVEKSIRDSFLTVDEHFLKSVDNPNFNAVDRSGSCALVCLVMGSRP